ncbi:MAG: hypothetical protein EBU90_12715 [Proteobacteria bacterium]|nr:hypothetical protein [Pseudomonadota bacterium]NBP14836.1 hypothetical protein [bacterium]
MENLKTFKLGLLLSSFLAMPFIQSAPDSVTLAAAVTAPSATNNYDTMILDRTTGDLYIGTTAVNAATNITKIANHNSDGTAPTTSGVASALATNKLIRLMAPSYTSAGVLRIAFVENTASRTLVNLQSADGTVSNVLQAALNDAVAAHPIANDGILALTASSNKIFAAVARNGAATWATASDGTGGRGVSTIAITSDTSLALTAVESTTGNALNAGTATAVLETADLTVGFKGSTLAITTAAQAVLEIQPSLHWDARLSRLYLGTGVTSGNTAAGDRGISVLVGRVDTTGTYGILSWLTTAATAAFDDVATGIIYTNRNASVVARHVKTMHTSTGHAYLIVNGGNGANNAIGNLVYAVPLVQGNATDTVNGTFAKNDLLSNDFSVQATVATDMVQNTAVEAKVGGGAAPFAATVLTTRLEVVGDTVYIAPTVQAIDATIETGVFHSTALFNEVGKIVAWTPWTRVCPSELGRSAADGDVANFRVNPRNGKATTIVGNALTTVRMSTWGEETAAATELASAVNAVLTDGCTAIGVFDRATVNWGKTVGPRMSLFGGNEKVVFTVQSRTYADPADAYNVPELLIGATANGATDFLSTTLPSGAGYVTALGGTLNTTTANAFYFLAGTTKGLYAYARAAGTGAELDYNPAGSVANLNAGFFAAGNTDSWQALAAVTGHVVAIKSCLAATFILARDIGTDSTIIDTLYKISDGTAATLTNLNAAITVIAQSGTSATSSDLTNATQILDFAIINGIAAGTDCQVVLATNNGLYQSKTAGGVEGATSQATALWTPIGQKTGNTSTDGLMYTELFQNKGGAITTTLVNPSFQGISLRDNSSRTGTYAYRGIEQFGCSVDDNLATGNNVVRHPSTTNYLNSDSFTSFLRLNRILSYWSDGARRFMIATPADGTGTTGLYIWPYRVGADAWNITDPVEKISASALSGKTLYCMNLLPDGHFAVGTNSGIVLL